MIGYTTVGTNDMDKATAFYDALFGAMGGKRTMDMETFKVWATDGKNGFSIAKPFDGKAATVGNGVMIALEAPDRKTVDKWYAKAMELGATDEGAPGPRGGEDSAFYAGYFRDLDGHKLNFYHFKQD